MPLSNEIRSHFFIPDKDYYNCSITIVMEGTDRELMLHIMNQLCFATEGIVYEGLPIIPNHTTLSRRVFAKRITEEKKEI